MRAELYEDYFELEDQHWWFLGRRAIFLRILDGAVGPQSDAEDRAVLDVGCGTGAMLRHLARYGRPRGVDTDPRAVELAKRRGVEEVELLTSASLPYEDDAFELVTALDVLEHIDDDQGMLREIHRVMRPGASVLISVPAYRFLWGLQDEAAHHRRRYVAGEVADRLVAAGLELRRLTYFNTLLFAPIAAVRLARRFLPRPARIGSDFEMTRSARSNALMATLFAREASLLERTDLPFGVSILALARKGDPRSTLSVARDARRTAI